MNLSIIISEVEGMFIDVLNEMYYILKTAFSPMQFNGKSFSPYLL